MSCETWMPTVIVACATIVVKVLCVCRLISDAVFAGCHCCAVFSKHGTAGYHEIKSARACSGVQRAVPGSPLYKWLRVWTECVVLFEDEDFRLHDVSTCDVQRGGSVRLQTSTSKASLPCFSNIAFLRTYRHSRDVVGEDTESACAATGQVRFAHRAVFYLTSTDRPLAGSKKATSTKHTNSSAQSPTATSDPATTHLQ